MEWKESPESSTHARDTTNYGWTTPVAPGQRTGRFPGCRLPDGRCGFLFDDPSIPMSLGCIDPALVRPVNPVVCISRPAPVDGGRESGVHGGGQVDGSKADGAPAP